MRSASTIFLCHEFMPEELIAADGLRARDNGDWGRDKLSFIDHFGPVALQATKSKRHRAYVDLFAGPGKNIVRGSSSRIEYDGSPLRALQMRASSSEDLTFTHAFLVNNHLADHTALQERVARLYAEGRAVIPRANVHIIKADANDAIATILTQIHPLAYAFVFADIEAPRHWPWSSVQALNARGHKSIDLYSLFPLDMAIQRLMSWRDRGASRYAARLTDYFGTDSWQAIYQRRVSAKQSPEFRKALIDLYLEQLRTHWVYAGSVKDVFLRGHQRLYRMLFASNNPVADRLAKWASAQDPGAQLKLL